MRKTTFYCEDCGKHVAEVDDYYYELDGVCYCNKCMTKRMRVI